MLEMAVQAGGTAPRAQVPGYRVAGKTGTAYKLEGGQYVRKYVASFVGFAPVSDPRLVVAVMIDEPGGAAHYGGDVAGPIFSTVTRWCIAYARRAAGCAGAGGARQPRRKGKAVSRPIMTPSLTPAEVLRQLGALGVEPRGVADDSRQVLPGDLFIAYPGDLSDGRRYIADAVARGAVAVLWETSDGFAWNPEWRVANLSGRGLRPLCGSLAHAVFGQPSERLSLIAITGTNGKTTISQWLGRVHPRRCAMIGTLGAGFVEDLQETGFTTPEATTLTRYLPFRRRRSAGLCAGSQLDRYRGRPHGRGPRRCGDLYQPDARSSRLPRLDGRLRGRQGPPVPVATPATGGGQSRRSVRCCTGRSDDGQQVPVLYAERRNGGSGRA